MADQDGKRTFENEEKHSIDINSNVSEEKEQKFKQATVKLKAEALRRFKLQEEEEKQNTDSTSKTQIKSEDLDEEGFPDQQFQHLESKPPTEDLKEEQNDQFSLNTENQNILLPDQTESNSPNHLDSKVEGNQSLLEEAAPAVETSSAKTNEDELNSTSIEERSDDKDQVLLKTSEKEDSEKEEESAEEGRFSKETVETVKPQSPVCLSNHSASENQISSAIKEENRVDVPKTERSLSKDSETDHPVLEENRSLGNREKEESSSLNHQDSENQHHQTDEKSLNNSEENELNDINFNIKNTEKTSDLEKEGEGVQTISEDTSPSINTTPVSDSKVTPSQLALSEQTMSDSKDEIPPAENTDDKNLSENQTQESGSNDVASSKEIINPEQPNEENTSNVDDNVNQEETSLSSSQNQATEDSPEETERQSNDNTDGENKDDTKPETEQCSQEQPVLEDSAVEEVPKQDEEMNESNSNDTESETVSNTNQENATDHTSVQNVADGDQTANGDRSADGDQGSVGENLASEAGDQAENSKEQTSSEQQESTGSPIDSRRPTEDSIDQNNEPQQLVEQKASSSQTSIVSKKSSTQIEDYELNDHLSKATTTPDIPPDFLTLFHSFGYECTKRWNLHMLSPDHIIFSAGNTFQILNLKTSEQINMRSTSGGGVGAIAVHPSRQYFAVSEKGVNPNIVIYQYPSLKLHRILRGGTEAAYSNLDFSPSGAKLASVGSYPDFMMTIWDWNKEQIVLRSKAFSQDVYKVAFSPEDEGHLCSSGTGHIKFWTMANTFTGLKLQGDLGRFGTTELSDISGFVELPDGKVLSGSEWGNMLLWDGGLIKAELTRKKKKTCHQGNIEQFFLDEGELITIGADGYVKVWDFESIDNADSLDESKLFEIEPMSELKVGADVKLLSMVKSLDEEESNNWFAQDSNGGIWSLDLSFSHTSQAPMKMHSYHSGKVLSLSMSPISHVAATTGEDGTVRLYDYFAKKLLCQKKFNSSGHSVLWIPRVIDTSCSSILVGFGDGVIRHLTITNSNKRTSKNPNASNVALHLSQVFKPHLKAVTCMVIDTPGKILATGSEDGIVFFFQIDKVFKPLGFVEVETHIVSLEWSSVTKGGKLLVVGKDGAVFEFKPPQAGKFDTSKSFQIPLEDLLINKFQFESVKDDLLRKEEEERKSKEQQEKQRKKQAEMDRKRALGITEEQETEQGVSEEGEKKKNEEGEDDEENENENSAETKEVHEKGNVLRGFYKCASSDNFILTLDGWDAGFFYECKFPVEKKKMDEKQVKLMKKFGQEPEKKEEGNIKAIKIPEISDVPVSSINFSKNGDFLAMGLQSGAIRVQNMRKTTFEKLDSYWFINAHGNQTGVIRDIAISFDNKFLMSVGEDGNIFTFSFIDQQKLKEFEQTRTQIKTKTIESRPADDIDDPKHYSIELEKQKAEHDKKLRLAEEKKQNVKTVIGKLRREFRKLKGKNAELPSYLQLPASDFIIDPQMRIDIEDETQSKVELLKKETAWESEKHEIAFKKLHQRYKALIECDRIVLYSFLTEHSVSSFRANELSDEFVNKEEENQEKMNFAGAGAFLAGQSTYRKSSMGKRKTSTLVEEQEKEEQAAQAQKQQQTPNQPAQKLEGKVAKMIEKAEQRKQKRIARQKEWEELYKNQPDENYEDPEDCEAIGLAQQTIGDFKLKTAADFVVPENERVNAEKKRSELFSLIRQTHDMKKKFNDKLLMLRNRKIESIAEIKELVDKLEIVQSHLPKRCRVTLPAVPGMKPEEEPEKKLEYTKETLIEFRKNVLGLEITRVDENSTTNTVPAIETHTSKATTRATNDPRLRSASILSTFSSLPPSGSSVMYETPDVGEGGRRDFEQDDNEDEKSEFQLMIEKEQEIRLTYERDELLREIREKLILFDAVLRLLRHEKVNLDTILKNAELRKVTLFEECMLLKDFEKRENGLAEKVYTKMQERDELEDKTDELKDSLDEQKEELEQLQERESSLTVTLNNTIGDGNKFESFLIKMYKKKIKRIKKKASNEGSSEENSEEDDSDDDYDDSDDSDVDSDDDEMDDTVCPPGCDPAIYDQICALRERRLDLEDALLEAKKLCDGMKKELDAMTKKVKVVDGALKNARSDLEAFQREKQQKLNELDVVVTLKLDQIQYVLNNALPQDLSKCLIIRGSFLNRLQRRIKELEREKVTQKQLYKERRQQHVQMLRDKKTMQKKIKELEERVQQIQLLKFGRLVDLEKLETVSVNRVAEELKEKLRMQEEQNIRDLNNWDKTIDQLQSELTVHVKENTKRLDTYTVLHRANRELEVSLDARQKNLGSEFQGDRMADEIERTRLAQLVQMQSSEIQQLEDEINMLSRKGGHVLPPHRNTQLPREKNNNSYR